MRIVWEFTSWRWFLSLFKIFFFLLIWLAGSGVTLLLLKKNKSVAEPKRYAIISSIGMAFLGILVLRYCTGQYRTRDIITVERFSKSWFNSAEKEKRDVYFTDYDDKIINLQNLMKKRQISLFSISDTKLLKNELKVIAKEDNIDYYYIDLSYAFRNYYSISEMESFWSQFAIDLISKIAKNPKSQKTFVFSWTIHRYYKRSESATLNYNQRIKLEEEEKYKLDHFLEILETLCLNMKNFNILILTESNELLYWVKGSSLSRITSVYKLSAHKVKQSLREEQFRNVKMTDKEKNAKLLNADEEFQAKVDNDEQRRDQKWRTYSQIKDKEDLEETILKDEINRKKREKKDQYLRDQRIKPYKVNLKDQENKAVLLSILKGSKTIGKNEWVQINQITDFAKIEDRFNYLVDKKVLERSGGVVKFINDEVHKHYNDELTGYGKFKLKDIQNVKLNDNWRRGKKKKRYDDRRWWVKLLWDHY